MNRKIQVAILLLVILTSCKKKDTPEPPLSVDINSISLFTTETHQIVATGPKKIEYSSSDDYFATVSNTGYVNARKVGYNVILVTSKNETITVTCTIKGRVNLYHEPSISWGDSRGSLISKLGTPDYQSQTAIGYFGTTPGLMATLYLFDGNDRLDASSVAITMPYTADLESFLSERYVPYDQGVEFDSFYLNAFEISKASLSVGTVLSDDSAYWMVIYLPYPPVKITAKTVDHVTKQVNLCIK
ncbi:MAG: Ig-like domain-containing protein [Bacteroidales bacterium]|nr:Ig-like domain-containing protein [Bacteroidales bacterium]